MFHYLPLGERRQDVCVHVGLVDDGLSPDGTLLRGAAPTGTRAHRLQTWTLETEAGAATDALTHRGVALLRLQVLSVHLVEFVKDGRHHGEPPSVPRLQNWKQARFSSGVSHDHELTSRRHGRTLSTDRQDDHLAVSAPQQEVHQFALVLQQVDGRRQLHVQIPQEA